MSGIKGHKRGSHKSRPEIANSGKLVLLVIRNVEFKEKLYFDLRNGNLIMEKWEDINEWYAGGVAPKAWEEAIAKTAPSTMSEIDLVKVGFSYL